MLDLVQHPYGETYNSLFSVMTFYGLKKTILNLQNLDFSNQIIIDWNWTFNYCFIKLKLQDFLSKTNIQCIKNEVFH